MLHEPWKTRLISFAAPNESQRVYVTSFADSPKTILGRKIHKRKLMSPSIQWLENIKGEIRHNELLSAHTSLCIGGPADFFILPKDIDDVKTIFKNRKNLPLFIIGEGTNLLASDQGFRGVVLCLKDSFKTIQTPEFSDDGSTATLKVGAGTKMSYMVKYAAKYSLSGIENLVGIPGSLGGALIMNAGADNHDISQVVKSVTRVNDNGEIQIIQKDEIVFEYRKTIYPPGGGIIVEAELELKKGKFADIQNTIDKHLLKRGASQPLNIPNSGSIFKNPASDSAGRLIESSGLKGYSIGDAGVSLKHANFIVNKNEATAEDVKKLIEHIQTVVEEKTGKVLEIEIVFMNE